jgi:hypothetical protein
MTVVAHVDPSRRPTAWTRDRDNHHEVPANTPINALPRDCFESSTVTSLGGQIATDVSDIGGQMRSTSLASPPRRLSTTTSQPSQE